jgi:serine/threonine protein kinase
MSLLPKKYTDVQPLTPGKNAAVFKATNSFLDRSVFLKIYDVPEDDPNSALQEPQLIQSLSHENLVRIFSADALRGNHLLLEMELIQGGSFQDLLDQAELKREWIGINHVLDLAADIACGLSALHEQELVHRDIKPANVMVRAGSDRNHAVVTDLGLVSALDATGRAFSSRHARIYRPPEVWAGKGYSKASDVYQVGIILYQLLGGTVPYQKSDLDDDDLSRLTVDAKLFDLTDIGPHIDRQLRTLIGKCICCEADRISSMPDLLSAIQAVKQSHLDWSFAQTPDGFSLTRTLGTRRYEVRVQSSGNKHLVTGTKTIGARTPRRFFGDQTITHLDLSRSQAFRALLKST